MEQEKLIALVKKAQSGDSTAMEQLLVHAHTAVSYQCRKFMNSPEDAEDMTQEVLMVIYQKLDTLTDPAAFNGWVKRIAATRCMNAVSRTHVDLQFSEDEEGNNVLDTIEELDAQKVPEAALDNAETSRMVVELIDALPEAQRVCTYLYYYNELSVKEIAKLTAATENTVKSRLNYARKAIKEGVLEHEKKGVKLYGLSPLPFLAYFLWKAAQTEASSAAAASCVAGVMAANAATAAAATTATTATAAVTTTAATTTTTATAASAVSGKVAGGVAGFLSKKLIAGIVAGVVALGGGAVATVQLVNNHTETVPAIICRHEWKDADCTTPKTCSKCESVEGEALGHVWMDADCEHPQTCQTCGATDGEAWGHTWAEATCEAAQVCQTCGVVGAEALGHDMTEADYQLPATCKICGHTEGTPLTPDAELYGLPVIVAEMGKEYEYRSACHTDTTKMSVGTLTMSGFGVAEPSAELTPVEGYEWYTVTFQIDYRYGEPDEYAYRYGINVRSLHANYYTINPWPASGEEDNTGKCFALSYNGEKYSECMILHSEHKFSQWYYGLCTYTCTFYWRVPVGYDGMILGYYDHANPIPAGAYLYDAVDENTLLFRFVPEDPYAESADNEEETTAPEGGQGKSETEAEQPSDNNAADETQHTHNYTSKTVAPGCVKIGYTEYTCSCGKAYRDNPTDPIGHKYSIKETIAPTETTDGYDLHTCERCGDSYKDNYVPMTGVDNSDHTGYYWADCDNDGHKEWWPNDCATEGHRWKNEIIQEATCCQPKIIDTRCQVVGCNAQKEGYPRESWDVNHNDNASVPTFIPVESYLVRQSDGYGWIFSDEASARTKAKQIADAYRNGESRIYVDRIQSSGYTWEFPDSYICTACGQTISRLEMEEQGRGSDFTGTWPENPYEDRRWVEFYTKDNQPDW